MSGLKRAFGQDDSDDEDQQHSNSKHRQVSSSSRRNGTSSSSSRSKQDELLTGYSRSGAQSTSSSSKSTSNGPRIIKSQSNTNWMEERKKALGLAEYARKNLGSLTSMAPRNPDGSSSVPPPSSDSQNTKVGADVLAMEQKSGLSVREKGKERSQEEEEQELKALMEMASSSSNPNGSGITSSGNGDKTPPSALTGSTPPPPTEEELARQALLSGLSLQDHLASAASNRIIPQSTLTEEELLKSDLDYKPSEPTLDDYSRTPVEGFGMALLRGMGWKEGEDGKGNNKPPEVKKRSALLGLGARDRMNEGIGTASGSKGKGAEKGKAQQAPKRAGDSRGYMPLVRRESDRNGAASSSSSVSRGSGGCE